MQFPSVPLQVERKEFLGNGGGASDDSMRSFGATTQFWLLHTTDGFVVHYDDNGAGVTRIECPDGTDLMRVQHRPGHTFEIDPQDFAPVLPHEVLSVRHDPDMRTYGWVEVRGRGSRDALLPGWLQCTLDETTPRGWMAHYRRANLPAAYAALLEE